MYAEICEKTYVRTYIKMYVKMRIKTNVRKKGVLTDGKEKI